MELLNLEMLITNICTFAGTFMFIGQRKNKLKLDNDSMASSQWKELYERSDLDSKKKDEKIEGLFLKIFDLQEQNNNLLQQVSQKDIEITELNHKRCIVRLCPKRDPQTGY